MQLFGKIVGKTDVQSGVSANGEWQRLTLLVQPAGDDGNILPFDVFGKKLVEKCECLTAGDYVELTYKLEGREYEDKWFVRLNLINFVRFERGGDNVH